jgi:hypothetical protein
MSDIITPEDTIKFLANMVDTLSAEIAVLKADLCHSETERIWLERKNRWLFEEKATAQELIRWAETRLGKKLRDLK